MEAGNRLFQILKIAQVSGFSLPVVGGIETTVFGASRELAKRGHQVEILSAAHSRYVREASSCFVQDSVKVVKFPVAFKIGDGLVWPGLLQYLNSNSFDVIHAHSYNHPHVVLSWIGSRHTGAKFFITPHNPFGYPNEKPWNKAVASLFDKSIGRSILLSSSRIFCTSAIESEGWARKGIPRMKLMTLPSPVGNEYFNDLSTEDARTKLGISSKSLVVLFVGHMHPQKGLLTLIRAFEAVRAKVPDALLILFGEYNLYAERIMRYADSLGDVNESLLFIGDQTSEDRKLLAYAACDVFVLPSVGEGYGLVLLEAMAKSKPVVASKVGGIPTIVKDGENGILVSSSNPAELAASLVRLLTDKNLRDSIGKKALATARNRTYAWYVDELEEAYARGI